MVPAIEQRQLEAFETGSEAEVVLAALAYHEGTPADVQEAAQRLETVASEECGLSVDSSPET